MLYVRLLEGYSESKEKYSDDSPLIEGNLVLIWWLIGIFIILSQHLIYSSFNIINRTIN